MKKVILLILDGWGVREVETHNAIKLSNPENYNFLLKNAPFTVINASEEWVGLPKGQMGNSEVGHMNIGAGRVVYQDIVRINRAIETKEIFKNQNITNFLKKIKANNGDLHFLGLLSDGGVHSHINHLKALLLVAKEFGIKNAYIHCFMDGRDTPPNSGIRYIDDLVKYLNEISFGKIATVSGRYYAMDRDKRWDRVRKVYDAIVSADGNRFDTAVECIKESYLEGVTDEFIIPSAIGNYSGMKDGDGIFFYNYRADRARELTYALYNKNFKDFVRKKVVSVDILTMTNYDKNVDIKAAFPPEELKNVLGEVVSNNNLTQLRISETEKYAHVTFFFNGGREVEFENEKRILIPSPKDVPTYDKKPEMSIFEVVSTFERYFMNNNIDITVMNFANPDMVGHTGVEEAAILACKAVDKALGRVIEIADKTNSVLIVTADHGNCEQMWDEEINQPHTSHTTNPVHFIVYNSPCKLTQNKDAKLADIAPTILEIMNINKPEQMTGESLIIK